MSRRAFARFATTLSVVALGACSDQSLVAPATLERAESPPRFAQPQPGQYDLEFLWSGTALTIVVHARTAGGGAPDGGTATVQYCSLGPPTDDITQPDEAASSACEDHSGHWVTRYRTPLNASGDAYLNFGSVSVVTVIGFRLRYSGEGSGVENGTVIEDWYRPL